MMERVLITGGSGFLGRAVGSVLVLNYDVVLGARNNAANDEAARAVGCEVLPLDVASIESVRDAFVRVRPDIVVHAAATKYVQLSEKQPLEAIDVNVVGSQNIARVAGERGTRVVIGVSTDKAAPPVKTTYGLSKALMERMFCSLDQVGDTSFACARFGNMAWSTGSVLPEWRRMLDTTGVIGTTGPEMRRYFLRVDEAAQIVVAAIEHIDDVHGHVVSRRMKAAVVGDLLDAFIDRLGGRREPLPTRPGDSVDEVLIGESEVAFTREADLAGEPYLLLRFAAPTEKPIEGPLSSATAERLDADELRRLIDAEPR